MKVVKIIKVFSDGSTHFSYKVSSESNHFVFCEKDHKNFFMNKKWKTNKSTKVSSYSKYKQKYV